MCSAREPAVDAPWPTARRIAYQTGRPAVPRRVLLPQALGGVLATEVVTLTDLPAFDTVSMDGWAVCGSGPWRITQRVLAGSRPAPLRPGEAAEIATGAWFPPGAESVLRREEGFSDGTTVTASASDPDAPRRKDVRPMGEEAKSGSVVVGAGTVVTPPVIGLVAAAGHDDVLVRVGPTVDLLVMGDELLESGPSGDGRLRDSISPQAAGWLAAVGAALGSVVRVPDERAATAAAITRSTADVVVTTGGTARGPVDQLHPALDDLGAQLLVDQVAVRPGHPMVLAELADGRPLLGLPGNPLAAAVAFVSLGWALVEAIRGLPLSTLHRAVLLGDVSAPDHAHRLMPVRTTARGVEPLLHHGPAMLSGLAAADAMAVAPPGGARSGEGVEVLTLPWAG